MCAERADTMDDAVHGSTDFRVLSSAQRRCTRGSNLKCRKAFPCLGGAESSRGNFALRAFNAFVCGKSRRPHHYVDVAGEMEAWYWSELTIRHDAGKIYGSISVAAGSAMARSRYHRTKGNALGISSGNFSCSALRRKFAFKVKGVVICKSTTGINCSVPRNRQTYFNISVKILTIISPTSDAASLSSSRTLERTIWLNLSECHLMSSSIALILSLFLFPRASSFPRRGCMKNC